MNSDLMPSSESSESSNLPTSTEVQNDSLETSSKTDSTDNDQTVEKPESTANEPELNQANETARQQPIPPPSEPMQYRAIGLVRGRYAPTSEQFTQGALVTPDNVELDAVLLGRIMSLVKNHLDLEKDHLWVVYPRTRQENDNLHLQIVGVWEPEKLAVKQKTEEQSLEIPQTDTTEEESTSEEDSVSNDSSPETSEQEVGELTPSSEIPDGGFSVRGEVVYQSSEAGNLVVKIKQAPRKNDDKPKYFKLKLTGKLETKAVGKFWDFQVQRQADLLTIEQAELIADLPKKRRPPFKRGGRPPYRGGGRPGAGKPPYNKRRSSGDAPPPRPVRKGQSAEAPRPASSRPTPKPVKRQKPPEG